MQKRNFKYESSKGLTYRFSKISIEESQHLIASKKGVLMPEHSSVKKTYHLEDGSVIIMIGGAGKLYPSFNDFFIMTAIGRMQQPSPPAGKTILKGFPQPRMLRYAENGCVEYLLISRQHAFHLIDPNTTPVFYYSQVPFYKHITHEKQVLLISTHENVPFYGLFRSEADCDQYMNYLIKEFENHHRMTGRFLIGRNPYGQRFPEMAPKLISQLKEVLELTPEDLTLSFKNYFSLQKKLKKYVFTDHFYDALFLPLLTWLGEWQIQHIGGAWQMGYDNISGFWVPLIRIEGRLHNIGNKLHNVIDPNSEEYPTFNEVLFIGTEATLNRFNACFEAYIKEKPPEEDPATLIEID